MHELGAITGAVLPARHTWPNGLPSSSMTSRNSLLRTSIRGLMDRLESSQTS